ncbi:hypothetical protein [Nocardia sp. MW-W600-9]
MTHYSAVGDRDIDPVTKPSAHVEQRKAELHVIDDVTGRVFTSLANELSPETATTLDEYTALLDRIGDSLDRVLLDSTEIVITGHLDHGVRWGYRRPDLDTPTTAKAALGMAVAGIVHGMRTPDPALLAVYSHAVRRLFIDGVRVAAR